MQHRVCRNCSHCATFVAIMVIALHFAVVITVIMPCMVSWAVSSCCIWCHEWCHHTVFGVVVTVIVPRMVLWALSSDCMVLWSWSPCCMRCQQCMQPRGACQHRHPCLATHCAIVAISRGGCGPLRERVAMSLGKEVEGNDLL
jgi:hypothetical protein